MARFNFTLNPPVNTRKLQINENLAIFIDPDSGDNSNDGLTPATALLNFAGLAAYLANREVNALLTVNLNALAVGSFGADTINVTGTGSLLFFKYNGFLPFTTPLTLNISGDDSVDVSFVFLELGTCTITNIDTLGFTFGLAEDITLDLVKNTVFTNVSITTVDATNGRSLETDNCTVTNIIRCENYETFAETATLTLSGANARVVAEDVFRYEINAALFDGTPRSNTDYAFSAQNVALAIFEDSCNYSGLADILLFNLNNVNSVEVNWQYFSVPNGANYTFVSSPWLLRHSRLNINTSGTVDNINIVGVPAIDTDYTVITTVDPTFGNIPYTGNLSLPAGTIVNTADANEIVYDNSGSSLVATDVEAALDELDAKFLAGVTPRETDIYGAINGNIGATAAQDLRRQNGTPQNLAPYGVKYDGEIYQVIISNATVNNYTIEVLINGAVQGSFTRNNGANVQIFDLVTPISITKGDTIRLRFAGGVGTTNRPAAQISYREV